MTPAEQKNKRTYTGTVISDKMDKTVVVKTERVYHHSRFNKTIRVAKNYKVHDEQEAARVGDTIEFSEGRPVSKTKYMYLVRVVNNDSTAN